MTVVAVAQFAPGTDKHANIESIEELMRNAVRSGARVVVLPEFSMYSAPVLDEQFLAHAERLDGDFVNRLSMLAAQHRVHIVAGMIEPADDDRRVFNTLVVVDDEGRLLTHYRKIHLYDAFGFQESLMVKPGEIAEPVVFEVDGVCFGLQTCYEIRFPEVTRRIVDAGAHVLLLPADWVPGPLKEDHWRTLIKARAIENTMYVAAADQTGPFAAGNSMIVDPLGVVLAGLGEEVGVASAPVSVDRVLAVRTINPALTLRRFAISAT